MGTINENPPVSWVIVTAASAFLGVMFFFAFGKWAPESWHIAGYIVSALIFSIPAVLGIVAGVQRRKLKRQV